ncbi:MAG: 4-hydroxy-tetrahydrodipicolinate synthase [Granulosicoccus sp.]
MFEGSYVALITPMTPTGELDEAALCRLVNWHINEGTQGLVPAGTTGESAVLSAQEHMHLIELVVDQAAGKIPVIAGCGSNNTAEALKFHEHASRTGANGALHVCGYYNRPSQEGIYQHFAALSSLNDLPIVVYNIPPRAVVDISVETMARLASLPTVVGVKDATQDLSRPGLEALSIQEPFTFLSGEDATAVAYNAAGGRGCISVTANVSPRLCAQMQRACLSGDFTGAMAIQRKLMPLHQALFLEPSPSGIKYACSRAKLCTEVARLPMVSLCEQTKRAIDVAMDDLGYIT